MTRLIRGTLLVLLASAGALESAEAQELRGHVVETSTGAPVPLAGVFLLDSEREVAASALADTLGRYVVGAPGGGEYYVIVQRLGYFETESPLVAISDGGAYELDFELRPEPFRLDPLLVTVRNEEMERWLTLELGSNPNSILGFRAIQGAALEEARFKAKDNTGLLRWLYIPVSHGGSLDDGTGFGRRSEVCLGSRMPAIERGTGRILEPTCGKLFIDGLWVPTEHLEELDKSEIAVVVLLPPNVRLYTYGFDWTFRPGGPGRR